jgi:diacylglycerol kinase (ATP)
MANYTILFNPHAGNGRGTEETKKLYGILSSDILQFQDITLIKNYASFLGSLPRENRIIISGGDGTLNRFINDTADLHIQNDIYYFATGSGNDFLHDVGYRKGDPPFCINAYIKNLPEVTVENRTFKFLNGIGYGIDGYCCGVGDTQRNSANKNIHYTSIAIKGLLFHYKPTNAVITVDGQQRRYKKVWLAPTMNGRFYGGGMMPTPNQDRLNHAGTVSTMVFFGSGKLKTLMVFPSIFKGEHIRHTEMAEVLTGHDITVEFDRPTALQIDGETIVGVTKYHVAAKSTASVKEICATAV